MQITWGDTERGRGPTGTAIRTGQPSVCRNIVMDPRFGPWREEAMKRGYASSLVVPLIESGKAFGAITIYSRQADAFLDDEVKLLVDLGADLAHGLTTIRERAARKRADEALRESESKFRALFESSVDAVFLTVPDGHVLAANAAACSMFRMSEAEICRASRQALVDTNEPRFKLAEEERRRTNRLVKAELTLVRANGERFPGEVDSVIMPGDPPRSFVIVRDISARKKAEQALIQNEKLASVGRMASTIAHEINNPLETIGHALYLASTNPGTSQEAKSYLDLASQELDRVTHITTQTLAFNRESKTPAAIDLRESVDGVLRLFESRLRVRGIAVEKRYDEADRVQANGGEIQQIISNLLSNSMDATQQPGRIVIHISRSMSARRPSGVRLTVADTGSGMPREQLKKIFEAFFTTKEVVGTGLGLWVTKQIVEKHGATIRVRSKPGRGTVFSMVFPTAGESKGVL